MTKTEKISAKIKNYFPDRYLEKNEVLVQIKDSWAYLSRPRIREEKTKLKVRKDLILNNFNVEELKNWQYFSTHIIYIIDLNCY